MRQIKLRISFFFVILIVYMSFRTKKMSVLHVTLTDKNYILWPQNRYEKSPGSDTITNRSLSQIPDTKALEKG